MSRVVTILTRLRRKTGRRGGLGRKTGAAPAGFGGIAARAFRDQQDGRGASGLGRQLQPTAFRQSDGAGKFSHHQPGRAGPERGFRTCQSSQLVAGAGQKQPARIAVGRKAFRVHRRAPVFRNPHDGPLGHPGGDRGKAQRAVAAHFVRAGVFQRKDGGEFQGHARVVCSNRLSKA